MDGSPHCGFGMRLKIPHRKKSACYEMLQMTRIWTDTLEGHRQRKIDKIWNMNCLESIRKVH
jgi:hypothetical protein